MKTPLHDRPISFRAPSRLVEEATANAHAVGMSLAEVLRGSLRAAAQGKLNLNGDQK